MEQLDTDNINLVLSQEVETNNYLKSALVKYAGNRLNFEKGNVTIEIIIDPAFNEFPEFILALAEENCTDDKDDHCKEESHWDIGASHSTSLVYNW